MSVGFDLGFLIKRSWILGIPIPKSVMSGRFVSSVFVDLMQEWGLHQFSWTHAPEFWGSGTNQTARNAREQILQNGM